MVEPSTMRDAETDALTSFGCERLAEVLRYRGLNRAASVAAQRREIEILREALEDLARRLGPAGRGHVARGDVR